ncbi:MAG: bacterial Ig-like domain-containing protein [Bacilli bacterium]|nr:bacterial Ig-like domain-containing protein [Bacilli bacterium]
MAKLEWDKSGERIYETGVSNGVLYLLDNAGAYSQGVVWNGLTNVSESPEGAEATALYADNIKYLNLMSTEEFKATVEAYTYPDEFGACNGELELADGVSIGQQKRKTFGMSYKTKVGNDVDSDLGYKIHLIYGALAAPSEKAYATINDSPEAITFSWELSTTPVAVTGAKPTASLVIDSTKTTAEKMAAIEAILYGSESAEARLPLPDEVLSIMNGKEVSSIAVTTAPTKTSYTAGETFDATGMVITATYKDSTTTAVTDYTFSPSGALATTDETVTISYTSGGATKTATQAITVIAG